MATTSKKRAARIAKKVIQQASEASSPVRSNKPPLVTRIEAAARQAEPEGRNALANLRRMGSEKLPRGEEVRIATRLYAELPLLKRSLRALGVGIGKFCADNRISDGSESSKALHRLMLAPDKDPKSVRLRRTAIKYRFLIEAISKVTGVSASRLADRVLYGTSMHPSHEMPSFSEAEKLQAALQGIVDNIDAEFQLFEKFAATATLKARHVRDGGVNNWPLYDLDVGTDLIPADIRARERANALDSNYAFWPRGEFDEPVITAGLARQLFDLPPSQGGADESEAVRLPSMSGPGVLQNNDFFYIPHAPLGAIEWSNLPPRSLAPEQYEMAVRQQLVEWRTVDPYFGLSRAAAQNPADDWDSEQKCPVGQVGTDEMSRGSDFAWLVIYPSRDGTCLMPMLYVPGQDGGAYLLPLDTRSLELLHEAVWLTETEHKSAFERIKDLLGFRPGTNREIEDSFRRTAPWFGHNPHFKRERAKEDELMLLDNFCQRLWEERR